MLRHSYRALFRPSGVRFLYKFGSFSGDCLQIRLYSLTKMSKADSNYDYDYFVIGGGSGGVRSSRIAAQHGARVALAEAKKLGMVFASKRSHPSHLHSTRWYLC